MISIRFHLTENEYFDYSYYTTWAAPDKKPYRRNYYLRVIILYALIAGSYMLITKTERVVIDLTVFSAIAVIYFLTVPLIIKGSIRRRVKEILSRPENAHILSQSEVIVSDTGIIDKDQVSETRYDWNAIIRKIETSKVFYLYTNSYHAVVIPKRTLKSDEEKHELKRLFDQHLPLGSEFSDKVD